MTAPAPYPFRHPAPFETALRYDFADCGAAEFFVGWRTYRQMLREKLEGRKSGQELKAVDIPGAISLSNLMAQPESLWPLIRKFEVFGRLFSHYDSDIRKHHAATPATLSDYIDFGHALANRAEQEECLQYLSTLLKVLDAITENVTSDRMATYDPEKLRDLLDREARLIERLWV